MRVSERVRQVEDAVDAGVARAKSGYKKVRVALEDVQGTVKKIMAEAKARRLVVENAEGQEMMSVNLSLGPIALFAPYITLISGLVALSAGWTISVELDEPAEPTTAQATAEN